MTTMTTASDNLFLSVWLNDTNDEQQTSNKTSAEKTSSTKKTKKTISKPTKQPDDGRPRRPLTSYNLFFKMERKRIMAELKARGLDSTKDKRNPKRVGQHANVGFGNLARMVSERWRAFPADARKLLDDQARADKERYAQEMEEWTRMNEMKEKQDAGKSSIGVSASVVTPEESFGRSCMQEVSSPIPTLPFFGAQSQDNASFICAPCGPTRPTQECEPIRYNSNYMTTPPYPQNHQVHYPSNYLQSNGYATAKKFMREIDSIYRPRGFNDPIMESYDMSQNDCSGLEYREDIDDVKHGLRSISKQIATAHYNMMKNNMY